MPLDLSNIFKTLEGNIVNLAKQSMSDYLSQGIIDGTAIVNNMRDKIEQWTLDLSAGVIDADDFKSLVLGEKDLLKMTALTQAGLALIRVDKFKNDVCNLIINTVTAVI